MRRKRILKTLMAVFLAVSVGIWSAPGIAETPGVTKTTIKLGTTMGLSGHVAFIGTQMLPGLLAYFQYINDQGGIHGRKIELIAEDDRYSPPKGVANVKKLLSRDRVFGLIATMGTPVTMPLIPIIEKEKVPLVGPLSPSSSMFKPPKRYLFPFVFVPYDRQARIIVDYIMKDLKQKAPRIGIIYQDDEVGRDTMGGLDDALKLYGLELASKQIYKAGSVDFTSQVLNLKRAKADFVILSMTTAEPPLIFKEASKFQYLPRFFGTVGLASDKVVELSGEDSKGFLVITNQASTDSNAPGVVEYRKSMEKYQPGQRLDFYSLATYGVARVFCEGVRRYGKDLTQEGFVNALETLKKFETGGIFAPISFGPNMRDAVNSGYFIKANPEKKKYEVYDTTWREPTPLK